jgi:hypothetical protein
MNKRFVLDVSKRRLSDHMKRFSIVDQVRQNYHGIKNTENLEFLLSKQPLSC